MAKTPENPLVFPQSQEVWGGLTLRDYFAGQALVGLIVHTADMGSDFDAACAYEYADAMLAERSK